jgi:hypothetical protein
MTDQDEIKKDAECKKCENCIGHGAGQLFALKIEAMLANKRVSFACYDWGIVYPHGAKDAGDMMDEEIRQCINNAISGPEHIWMSREFPDLRLR